MARIQAYCGLDCGECEAYVATQFFVFAPVLKDKLEAIRKEIGK